MKLLLTLTLVLCLPALALGAQMMLTSGGQSTVYLAPGGTIPVLLSVDTQGVQIAGFEVRLHGEPGWALTISHWAPDPGGFFPDYMNGNLIADRGPATGLILGNPGPGIVNLATFDLTLASNYDYGVYGNWILTTPSPLVSDANAQPTYTLPGTLHGVPEPMSLLLLAMGAVLVRWRR